MHDHISTPQDWYKIHFLTECKNAEGLTALFVQCFKAITAGLERSQVLEDTGGCFLDDFSANFFKNSNPVKNGFFRISALKFIRNCFLFKLDFSDPIENWVRGRKLRSHWLYLLTWVLNIAHISKAFSHIFRCCCRCRCHSCWSNQRFGW